MSADFEVSNSDIEVAEFNCLCKSSERFEDTELSLLEYRGVSFVVVWVPSSNDTLECRVGELSSLSEYDLKFLPDIEEVLAGEVIVEVTPKGDGISDWVEIGLLLIDVSSDTLTGGGARLFTYP